MNKIKQFLGMHHQLAYSLFGYIPYVVAAGLVATSGVMVK